MMESEQNNTKETWSEPQLIILDFKNTKGGGDTSIAEELGGTISTLPG